MHEKGWTDGLPVVLPTEEAVAACLAEALMPPEQLLGVEPVRGRPITAEKVAINAVMAGCAPEHFPAVVTAWNAMLSPPFLLHGATASTGGCAVLAILHGLQIRELVREAPSCPGESDRAGTALAEPCVWDSSICSMCGQEAIGPLGHPGKPGWCLAEDEVIRAGKRSLSSGAFSSLRGDGHTAMAPRQS